MYGVYVVLMYIYIVNKYKSLSFIFSLEIIKYTGNTSSSVSLHAVCYRDEFVSYAAPIHVVPGCAFETIVISEAVAVSLLIVFCIDLFY